MKKERVENGALFLFAGGLLIGICRMCEITFAAHIYHGALAFVILTVLTIAMMVPLLVKKFREGNEVFLPGIVLCLAAFIYSSYRFFPFFSKFFSIGG